MTDQEKVLTRCDAVHKQGRCMRESRHDGLHSVTVEDGRTGSHVVEWRGPVETWQERQRLDHEREYGIK